MPVIKSAKKKLRADKKRTLQNKAFKNVLKELVKKAKSAKTEKAVIAATVAIDKAAKKNVIHKNKAARFKSGLSKILSGKTSPAASGAKQANAKGSTKKPQKKTASKASKSPSTKQVTKKIK